MKRRTLWILLSLATAAAIGYPYLRPDGKKPVKIVKLTLKQAAAKAGVDYPPKRIFIRTIKQERVLELWGANTDAEPFRHLKTYPIAAMSGIEGPKRVQGDCQVPEGFYHIDRFNPNSAFHLSLGLNYPNQADRIRGDRVDPGGDIFIHGGAASIGCMAMTDPVIDEIYPLAVAARKAGQKKISVHIFPARMTFEAMKGLREAYAGDEDALSLWTQLQPGYDCFEATGKLPKYRIDAKGNYVVRQ